MTFQQKLDNIIAKNNSLVCVGLDSDIDKLPESVKNNENPQFEFNKAIIDATHDLVCAYKPNSAFYEALGERGVKELKMTCDYLTTTYPEIPIILDAKRADIGNTNEGYVKFAFDYLQADAITLHPYLGGKALEPFLKRAEKGCIILCRTSNPMAGEFQDLSVILSEAKNLKDPSAMPQDDKIKNVPLYLHLAKQVSTVWNTNNNCLLVVGATYPEELAQVRQIVGDMTLLVPGIGAQGGDVEKTVKAGLNSAMTGMIINSSRGIIFASKDADFSGKAREQAIKLKEEINKVKIKLI